MKSGSLRLVSNSGLSIDLPSGSKSNALGIAGEVPDWAHAAAQSILISLKLVDPMTFHHCLRVGEGSLQFARALGLSEYQQKMAQFAGLLHDVGKMGISAAIVHKPGKLDSAEADIMKTHSVLSEEIVAPLAARSSFFKDILPSIRGHHERVDGRGYPDGLVGDQIPLVARLILIVDTLDAMSQNRSYRAGLPLERIYEELLRYSGTQFDDRLVPLFLESHPKWKTAAAEAPTFSSISLFDIERKVA